MSNRHAGSNPPENIDASNVDVEIPGDFSRPAWKNQQSFRHVIGALCRLRPQALADTLQRD
jgi:hypothetical protein